MQWEIVNMITQPKCVICVSTTEQMAKFYKRNEIGFPIYICSDCARFVKDAMNEWDGVNYIGDVGKHFDSKYIDKVIEENKDKALFPEVNPVCRCGQTGLHSLTNECRQK